LPRTAANAASSLAVGALRRVHPSWEGLATAPKSCARSEPDSPLGGQDGLGV